MKNLALLLSFLWVTSPGYAQQHENRIPVSDNIYLEKVSESAYVHVSYDDMAGFGRVGSNGLLFIQNGEAFLFDSPVTEATTRKLVDFLSDSMKLTIKAFIPNHWHDDCMGGLAYLRSLGIPSYANQMTIDIARSRNLPVPQHGFTDSLQLKLGDRDIFCYYFGAAHSLDNIVVWIPSEKVLFPGCMIKSMKSVNLGNTADGDTTAYPGTIAIVKSRFPRAALVIPGHGDYGGTGLIDHTLKLATQ